MGNIGRVFISDLKHLAKAPAAWTVALFLIVLPSLYTWFNVAAFWDPYSNTAALRVCVVNEDRGAQDSTLGSINLGEQIEAQLRENEQLGWAFLNRDEAMDEVEAGHAYAALVIPAGFSDDLIQTLRGHGGQPAIEYYVNEKLGPVSPKITDTGANMLDTQINETFVSTVSSTLAQLVNAESTAANERITAETSNSMAQLATAQSRIGDARTAFADLAATARDTAARSQEAKTGLETAQARIDDAAGRLPHLAELIGEATRQLTSFAATAGASLDDANSALTEAVALARSQAEATVQLIGETEGDIDAALEKAHAIAEGNEALAAALRELASQLAEGGLEPGLEGEGEGGAGSIAAEDLEKAAALLEEASAAAEKSLDDLEALASDLAQSKADIAAISQTVADAAADALANADGYRTTLQETVIPQVANGLSLLAEATARCSAIIAAQSGTIDHAMSVLDQLSGTLGISADALERTDRVLAGLQGDLASVSNDLAALQTSEAIGSLIGDGLDVEKIADFMLSPTMLQTEKLYPLNAYGSAMAPLFINLTLWIGVFMLMVIIRKEVEDDSIPNLTINQRFFGRGILLAIMAALQAAVCCAGCLALGVQTASAPLFFVSAIATSLAYLCIQYTLSTTLQHIGMGICVILVFVQIPGATGLYPIEMTPDFFQAVYPAFPFTYGIAAIRETIGGFYPSAWETNMAVLAAFAAAFLIIGSIARPYLTNLNRLFSREVRRSDLIHGEVVLAPEQHFRTSLLIRALSDREEFREVLDARQAAFMARYPLLKRIGIIAGLIVPVIGTALLVLAGAEKVVILTSWLIWFAVVVLYLIVVEYVKDSLIRQSALSKLSDDEMRSLYPAHSLHHAGAEQRGKKHEGGRA